MLGELYQMGGSGVYVGSAVDEEGDAVICGDEGCDRCAVDAADTADNKLTADQYGSGTSGGEEGVRLSVRYELLADDNGTVLLAADGLHRRLVTADLLRCVHDTDTRFIECICLKLRGNHFFSANEDDLYSSILRDCVYSALDHRVRGVITAHGVHNNRGVFFFHNNKFLLFQSKGSLQAAYNMYSFKLK